MKPNKNTDDLLAWQKKEVHKVIEKLAQERWCQLTMREKLAVIAPAMIDPREWPKFKLRNET
jgi:hypothetical protein